MTFLVQHTLISARFVVTFGHLIALLVLLTTIEQNVVASLGDNYSESERKKLMDSAWVALIFSLICFLFDFSGIFLGTSLFRTKGNLFQIFFHFVGSIFLSWMITENWNAAALWPIVLSCNLPTALYEIALLVGIYVLHIVY